MDEHHAGEQGPQREGIRAAARWGWIAVGASMLALFAYGIFDTVPDRAAVAHERRAVDAFDAGDYATAESELAGLLRREPNSAHARFILACVFFSTGHRSWAALELTLAFEEGLPLALVGRCGNGPRLDRRFFTAKLGLTDAFAVPRVRDAERYEEMLESGPAVTDGDDAERLLIGACLSFRARLDGAGWYYAANAIQLTDIRPAAERRFVGCLGSETLARLGCAASPAVDCLLSDRIRQAYLNARPHLQRS